MLQAPSRFALRSLALTNQHQSHRFSATLREETVDLLRASEHVAYVEANTVARAFYVTQVGPPKSCLKGTSLPYVYPDPTLH